MFLRRRLLPRRRLLGPPVVVPRPLGRPLARPVGRLVRRRVRRRLF